MPRPLDKKTPVRHKKTRARDPISSCLRRPVIRRIARRAEVKRIADSAFKQCPRLMENYLKSVLKDAILYSTSRNKKTVSFNDMIHALKKRGTVVYSGD